MGGAGLRIERITAVNTATFKQKPTRTTWFGESTIQANLDHLDDVDQAGIHLSLASTPTEPSRNAATDTAGIPRRWRIGGLSGDCGSSQGTRSRGQRQRKRSSSSQWCRNNGGRGQCHGVCAPVPNCPRNSVTVGRDNSPRCYEVGVMSIASKDRTDESRPTSVHGRRCGSMPGC